MRGLVRDGVGTFVEIGPGQVLSGLVAPLRPLAADDLGGRPGVARASCEEHGLCAACSSPHSTARSPSSPGARAGSVPPSRASSPRPGAKVAVNYRSGSEAAESIAAEIGGVAMGANVGDPGEAQALVERVESELGDVDVLVNNAGVTRDTLIARMSDEDWDEVIDTNLRGTFNTCRAVSRKMLRRRAGAIVNLTSVVGIHGNPGQANYAASKAGIIGLTKALARELGVRGVRVNAIAPGYITTELTEVLLGGA